MGLGTSLRTRTLTVLLAVLGACPAPFTTGKEDPEEDAGQTMRRDVPPIGPRDVPSTQDGGVPCGTIPTFADGFVPVRERFVTPEGDDDGNDGSMARPWATLTGALARATAGDRVTIRRGLYHNCGPAVRPQGTAQRPIWIRGEMGTVVDCEGGEAAIRLQGARYVVIENLEARNAMSYHLVHIDGGSSHVLLRGLHLHRAGLAIVKANQSDHLYIERCDVHEPGSNASSSQGIDFVGVRVGHVVGNTIHDVPENVALQAKGGSSDVLFARNTFTNVGEAINLGGVSTPMFFEPLEADYEGLRIVARNNLVTARERAVTAQGCHDCQIVANTIWGGGTFQALRALTGNTGTRAQGRVSTTRNLVIMNNIIAWPVRGESFAVPCSMEMGRAGLRSSNNLWWSVNDAIQGADGFAECQIASPGSLVDVDPQLRAPAARPPDFRPGNGSPAVNAGVAVPGLVDDFRGRCRGSFFDIGAFSAE